MKKLIAKICMMMLVSSSFAVDGTWTNSAGDRLWSTAGNWEGNQIASGADATAYFTNAVAGTITNTYSALTNCNFYVTNANYTITGGTNILDGVSGTSTFNVASSLVIGTVLQGTNTLYKIGDGTLSLTGVNTYSGGTIINGGGVGLSANSSLGAMNAPLTLNGLVTLPNSINYGTRPVVLNNGAIFYGLGIGSFTIGGEVSGEGGFQVSNAGPQAGQGRVYLTSTNNTFTGPLVIAGGNYSPTYYVASIGDAPGAGQIQFAGGSSAGGFLVTGGSSPIVLNYRQFRLAYNYHGPFIGNNNSGDADTLTVNTDLLVTATDPLTLSLGGSNTGTNTFAGAITNGSAVINVAKVNGGKWVLSGTNTYSGITTISAGTLVVNNSLAIQNSTMTFNAGTLNFGTPTSYTFGGLTGAGNFALTNTVGAIALIVGNKNTTTNYTGIMSGSGSLNKIGTGSLTLTKTNTFSGAVTVTGGTLSLGSNVIGQDGAVSGMPVTVGASGTLQYNNFAAQSVSYPVSGSGTWLKTGNGILSIVSTNTIPTMIVSNSTVTANSPLVFNCRNLYLHLVSTVNAIATNVIKDNATVFIVTGGGGASTPKIAFGSGAGREEVIGRLYIDGVQQPFGTYGATGSGAQYINDDVFSNTNGVVRVSGAQAGVIGGKALVIGGKLIDCR